MGLSARNNQKKHCFLIGECSANKNGTDAETVKRKQYFKGILDCKRLDTIVAPNEIQATR